jgi:hypothetical protein
MFEALESKHDTFEIHGHSDRRFLLLESKVYSIAEFRIQVLFKTKNSNGCVFLIASQNTQPYGLCFAVIPSCQSFIGSYLDHKHNKYLSIDGHSSGNDGGGAYGSDAESNSIDSIVNSLPMNGGVHMGTATSTSGSINKSSGAANAMPVTNFLICQITSLNQAKIYKNFSNKNVDMISNFDFCFYNGTSYMMFFFFFLKRQF